MELVEIEKEVEKGSFNLMDIEILVSKEEKDVMDGEDFRNTLTLEPNQDITNLNNTNCDDLQLAGEIDMQWYVFKKYNMEEFNMMNIIDFETYYEDYIYDYSKEIVYGEHGELSEFEVNFPDNSYEMKIFIEAFESIFPKTNHQFERYIKLLEGFNIMYDTDDNFRNSELFMDIIDYIREEALEELTHQIMHYPQKNEQAFDFVGYIEELNEELGFDGANSEIIEEELNHVDNINNEDSIDVLIEGNHYTTLQIILKRQDLEKHLKNNTLKWFILKEYEIAIADFDFDDYFDKLYDSVSLQYRASQFLDMIKEDEIFFINTIRDAIKLKN